MRPVGRFRRGEWRRSPVVRRLGAYLAASIAVACVALPVVVEQSVERAAIDDSVGTLPVTMSLCRQGRSTLETGVLGDINWEQTGPAGFGVRARVTGPPVAGRTLASYADRRFIGANVAFLDDPEAAVAAYGDEFRSEITSAVVSTTLAAGLVGGLVVVVLHGFDLGANRSRRVAVLAGLAVGALAASTAAAYVRFERWPCNREPAEAYAMPGMPELSFSSPQTREIAVQIRPFIEKNTSRVRSRAEAYRSTAETSFARQLSLRADALQPRRGEAVVIAEADPQGSFVGTTVREALYKHLIEALGRETIAFRSISGDISSNGTVAEDDFVALEAHASGDIPVVATAGDHDSETTSSQMTEHGMVVPARDVEEVAGLHVAGANDVEHKALFGQLVSNDSGLTEEELGEELRGVVPEDEATTVLLHQPDAVAGYLGVDSIAQVRNLSGSLTQPYDDGIPDVPPGTVTMGHLHDADGPWVLWNTDSDKVTWTVVDQLGTSGGVEEKPTFNRFSTPISVPLKPMSWRLQYVDTATGLQTGFVTISCDVAGQCRISDRTDVGLPLDRQ